MKNLNFYQLSKKELNNLKREHEKSCDCGWFNGMMKDYYDSTCGCAGIGSVFGLMF